MLRHPKTIYSRPLVATLVALTLASAPEIVAAQTVTPTFTYQGELRLTSGPATGVYDLLFRLYDADSGGSQVGPTLAASNLSISDGLFSVPLNFGPSQFAGDRQWLEIQVRQAGIGAFETLSPRMEITAAPYAWGAVAALANSVTTTSIVDGTIGSADINAAQVQRRVISNCPAGQYIREVSADGMVTCETDANSGGTVTNIATGAGLTGGPITATGVIAVAPGGIGVAEINASQVQRRVTGACSGTHYVQQINADGTVGCGPAPTAAGWSLTGNTGTDPSTDFIGTTDAQPFVVRTANARSLRIEPSSITFGSPALPITTNTIGGSHANEVVAGVRGATIAGGGMPSGNSDPSFGVERPNRITDHYGFIGGGFGNVSGNDDEFLNNAGLATVGGGLRNVASGYFSTVGGGDFNIASGDEGTVGGGFQNTSSGAGSTIGGGANNRASASFSMAAGGVGNTASGESSSVAGGANNTASGARSAIGGGVGNLASASETSIGGGDSNSASAALATVGGGQSNTASGFRSVVGGGFLNSATGVEATVSGGGGNLAAEGGATVGGGASNVANLPYSTVGGGVLNIASGIGSTVSGGSDNCAGGDYSWAGGKRAKIRPAANPEGSGSCSGLSYPGAGGDQGTFVWADAQPANFVSTAQNQFLVRAQGGIYLGTNSTVSIPAGRFINTSTGAHLTIGGAWTNASSRIVKSDFVAVDPAEVLARVLRLGITTWAYRDSIEGRHMGPIAEEFYSLFGLGGDDRSISTVDADGVALAAIQGLNAKLEAENAALRADAAEIRARLQRLEAFVHDRINDGR